MPNTLPFETLPGAEAPNPQGAVQLQFEQESNRVQEDFNRQWELITKNSRVLGKQQTERMLQKLTMEGQEKAFAMQQDLQKKNQFFEQIDNMEKAGLISNADEMRWRVSMGSQAAGEMFPAAKASAQLDMSQARGQVESRIGHTEKELAKFEEYNPWFSGPGLHVKETKLEERRRATKEEKERFSLMQADLKKSRNLEMALLKGGKFAHAAARSILEDKIPSTFGQKIMAQKEQQGKQEEQVLVINLETGQPGNVPASKLQAALASGKYKRSN